jgi:hypothetical protein
MGHSEIKVGAAQYLRINAVYRAWTSPRKVPQFWQLRRQVRRRAPSRARLLGHDGDKHLAVTRFAHTIGGFHELVAFPMRLGGDAFNIHLHTL